MFAGFVEQQVAAQDISVEAFLDLVAVGSTAQVGEALKQQPKLATATNQNGFSAVHVLDYADFSGKLALLQRFGADMNAQNDQGHGLLHMIIDPQFIPVAVAAGAEVNLRDTTGRTPVMVALLDPSGADFVPAFLAVGADPNARDNEGKTLLDYAAVFENSDLTSVLVKAGAVE